MASPLATAQSGVTKAAVDAATTARFLTETLNSQSATYTEDQKAAQEALKSEGAAKVELERNKQIDEQNRSKAINEAAVLMQVQQGSPEMAMLSESIDRTEAEVFQYSDKLAKMADVSPANDLIGWLGNQITAPFIQEDLAKKQQNLDVYKKEMQDRNLLAQTRFNTIEMTQKRASDATSAAIVAEAAANALTVSATAKAAATKSGMEVTNMRFAHNSEQLNIATKNYDAIAKGVSLAIAQTELGLKQNADRRAAETHTEQMKLYKEAEEGKEAALARINAASAAAGLTIQFKNAKDFNALSAKEKDAFMKLGSQYNATTGTINGTWMSQQDFFKVVGVTPPPEMQKMFGELSQIVADNVKAYDAAKGQGPKFSQLEKHAAESLIFKWTHDKWNAQSNNSDPDDFKNPYVIKSVGKFLQTDLGANMVATSPVIAPIKGAAASDPNFILNPQQLVENGTVSGIDLGRSAKETARVMKLMVQSNYQDINGPRLGMPPPTSYRVQQQFADGTFQTVDYLNPTAIANFTLKKEFIKNEMAARERNRMISNRSTEVGTQNRGPRIGEALSQGNQ